jgi:hypothetical protein
MYNEYLLIIKLKKKKTLAELRRDPSRRRAGQGEQLTIERLVWVDLVRFEHQYEAKLLTGKIIKVKSVSSERPSGLGSRWGLILT